MTAQVMQSDPGPCSTRSTAEALKFRNQILESLRSTLAYTIETGHRAQGAIVELNLQHEQLNSIKRELNKAQQSMTITERLVDSLVSSASWIKKTLPWPSSEKAETLDVESLEPEDENKTSMIRDAFYNLVDDPETINSRRKENAMFRHGAVVNFAMQVNQELDNVLQEMEINKQKTQIISNVVERQNDDIDKISKSTCQLKDRMTHVNQVLANSQGACDK